MSIPPQFTYKVIKSPCHFSRKNKHRTSFQFYSFHLDKNPRTPKFVKSKEKHPFRGDFFKKPRPTILQSYNSTSLLFIAYMYVYIYQRIMLFFVLS